jgi:gentisate 1,2-dioxygenase
MITQSLTNRAERPALSEDLRKQREAFYAELPSLHSGALWNVLGNALTREPRTKSLPHLWKWSEMRPRVLRSGELVTAEEAERRVLMLLNPGLPPENITAVGTLYAGIQLILPGEIARTHHHTPAATRFIMEGELAYTTVSGERTLLKKGDYATTPNWAWHDHGNESDRPMMWLDGLDIPFVGYLDAVFFEEWEWEHDVEVQPVVKPREDSAHRWGSNLRPTYQPPDGAYSPILNYPWETCRAAIHALCDDPGSPFDGAIVEYINPHNGGPSLPTMAAYLQLLRKDEHTKAHRHTSSTVYHVAEGGGYSVIAGQRFDWQEGDTFVVPSWSWHEHASQSGEAVLFSFSDRPVIQSFGLYREAALERGYQG